MKPYLTTTYIYSLLLAASVALFGLTACQSDEPAGGEGGAPNVPDGTESEVKFTIASRASGDDRLSRAKQDDQDNELMHNWVVLFVRDNEVKYRVEGSSDTGIDEKSITLKMTPATYDVYAFANTESMATNLSGYAAGSTFDVTNATVEPLTAILNSDNPIVTDDRNIPMSSKKTQITVLRGNTPNNNFTIWLVRLLAKVEFEFLRDTDTKLSVTGVTFGQLYAGGVRLLPETDADNKVTAAPWIPEDATPLTGIYNFAALEVPPAVGDAEGVYKHFYIRETEAESHPTGEFYLSVKLENDSEARFALAGRKAAGETLTQIRRNDYIQIPIKLSDYRVELAVKFYPPIGGYPAVVENDKTKEEFYIDFKSIGNFRLIPKVFKNDVELTDGVEITYTVDDPKPILKGETSASKIRNEAGELLGSFVEGTNAPTGTAVVNVTFKIKQEGSADRIITRKVFINRVSNQ